MSVARDVLSGLFGGAKVGAQGLVRRKAEERARMDRQQEQAANREFDLEMMRERQAAQRAAARRAALEAKRDRTLKSEEATALANYRQNVLDNQQDAAEATALNRREAQRFSNLNAVMQQFGAQEARMIDALSVPYTEEKRKTMLADIAKGYGFSEDEISGLYGTLPDLASIRRQREPTQRDAFVEQQLGGKTEEELGRELNELVNLRDDLEGLGVNPERGYITGLGWGPPYSAGGGTDDDKKEHARVESDIARVEELLSKGSRYGFDYVPSGDG
jgi:hypothetical protein